MELLIKFIVLSVCTNIASTAITVVIEEFLVKMIGYDGYKVKLGSFEKFDKYCKNRLYPSKTFSFRRLYEVLFSIIPFVNIFLAIFKSYNTINNSMRKLEKKNIIEKMSNDELQEYNNIELGSIQRLYVKYNFLTTYEDNEEIQEELETKRYGINMDDLSEEDLKRINYQNDMDYFDSVYSNSEITKSLLLLRKK